MNKLLILTILSACLTINAFSQNWLTNFDEAKAKATNEHKNILLVFSGTDWCAPCIKLDKFIWQSEEFKAFSNDHFVLLKADFPKLKKNQLPAEQQEHNNMLAEEYNKNGYFPHVVILNNQGTVVGTTGYKNISPKEYINLLVSLEK